MNTHAFTQPARVVRATVPGPAASHSFARRALGILVLCACAGAGSIVGTLDGQRGTAGANPRIEGQAPGRSGGLSAASGQAAIDSARSALRELGLRTVAECDAACAAQPVAVAPRFAAERAQAVIVAGASADAATLVHRLRAAGSHAVVVLAAPADPAEVVRRLPEGERDWLMAAVRTPPASAADAHAPSVSRRSRADDARASIRLAVVGRNGTILD